MYKKNDGVISVIKEQIKNTVKDLLSSTRLMNNCGCFIAALVACVMSVINAVDDKRELSYICTIFGLLCGINIIISGRGPKGEIFAKYLFRLELLLMASMILFFGSYDGFCIMWFFVFPVIVPLLFDITEGLICGFSLPVTVAVLLSSEEGRAAVRFPSGGSFDVHFFAVYFVLLFCGLIISVLRAAVFSNYRKAVVYDPVSNALNFTEFLPMLRHAMSEAAGPGGKLSFGVFDIDHFKRINDQYGRSAGDGVLLEAARTMEELTGCVICRVGSDEFCFLDTEGKLDRSGADRIVRDFSEHEFFIHGEKVFLTVSMGCLTAVEVSGLTDDRLFDETENLLVLAKDRGRNCAVFKELTEANPITSDPAFSVKTVSYLMSHDSLTDLLNRSAFERYTNILTDTLSAEETEGRYAMMVFDIIRLKSIHELYGKEKADRLFIYIAGKMNELSPEGSLCARYESDRFAVFMHASRNEAAAFADSLINAVSAYFLSTEIMCNAGIYMLTDEKLRAEQLYDRAEMALQSVEGNYLKKFAFFSDEQRMSLLSEQAVTGSLMAALANGEFEVHYQPVFRRCDGKIAGAEALVRWNRPDAGLILPSRFIKILEKDGSVINLDRYVFTRVCAMLAERLDGGKPAVCIGINITRHELEYSGFISELESIRKEYGIPVDYIRIEITEGTFENAEAEVMNSINELHRLGYIIAMDDFGSGYSSLNTLSSIDVDLIKLDMNLVRNINRTGRGDVILGSIIRMSRDLGIPVIAEGIETPEQAEFLFAAGCEYIQGFLYSRPVSENDFCELMDNSIRDRER